MITCVDFDDFHEKNHKLERLWELKAINPLFRCTVFAVPALGSDDFWASVPRWIELAVHGWEHPHAYECAHWNAEDILRVMDSPVVKQHFVNGWKSPGWQTSDAIYEVIRLRGWWIAEQQVNVARPSGLRVYIHDEVETNWHGHIQDWGSNGIDETWPQLVGHVRRASEFRFASELVYKER